MEPWLILDTDHLTLRVLCRDELGVFNVGFCEVLDLREEVTVGVALIASAIVSPFQGLA